MANDLDAFLEKAKMDKREANCAYCGSKKLASAIKAFLDKKVRGETTISLNYLHDNFLVPILGAPPSLYLVTRHIRICLSRHIKTGKKLD